jgi:hypothetical protein
MCQGSKSIAVLESWFKNRSFNALDVSSFSGGIITGWGKTCRASFSSSSQSMILDIGN